MAKRNAVKRLKRKKKYDHRKTALDIIEEAVHLVRTAPFGTLALYYIGSLPFILGLLYFWTDMIRNAYASKHCAAAALGLSLLFVWMKSWQTMFTRQLLAGVRGTAENPWKFRRVLRLAAMQTIIQPWGILILPAALLMTLPFSWMYAFYQNVTVLGDGEDNHVKRVITKSWKQARLWPKQNLLLIWLLSPWLLAVTAIIALVFIPLVSAGGSGTVYVLILYLCLLLFVLLSPLCVIVAVNIALALIWIPYLLKTFFGIETIFTLSGFHIMNSTFFAVVCGIVYICLDLVIKTAYMLRCFYGEALHSGEDLKADLQGLTCSGKMLVSVLVITLCLCAATPSHTLASGTPATPDALKQFTVPVQELDESLQREISSAEYAWRRSKDDTFQEDPEETPYPPVIEAILETLGSVAKTIGRWIDKIMGWLEELLPGRSLPDPWGRSSSGRGWVSIQGLLYLLLAVAVCMLALLLWRVWKRRRQWQNQIVAVEEITPVPDVADEHIDARELPEDGWLTLAEKLMKEGQLRLALRAIYLAVLANLAQNEFITIARFKSDREYQRELERRAYTVPSLLEVFTENMLLFEQVWYGTYEVTQAVIDHFTANYQKIKSAFQTE